MKVELVVEQAGFSTVQDLGRVGYAAVGVSVNGALDQDAARTANLLVGNPETAALVETTGSSLTLRPTHEVLLAATGAAEGLVVDGHRQPAWTPVPVGAGSRVDVPLADVGYRTYLAVNGQLEAEEVLGSVALDKMLGTGRVLAAGDRLTVETRFGTTRDPLGRLFRIDGRPAARDSGPVLMTPGPELELLADDLEGRYELLPESDQVGLRLRPRRPLVIASGQEMRSRGVPVGAAEVVPSGELIILLRGRLVTAGYPVVGVVATHAQDRLAQLRPGDAVDVALTGVATARAALRARAAERAVLADRVRTAFAARGIADAIWS